MVLGATVLLCLVTTAPGNVFLLLAVFWNIPTYKPKRFCFFMGVGLVLSMLLEPTQISYFFYVYLIVLILGEDIHGRDPVDFTLYSYGFLVDFYRIYIMLSHVSFLNLLIGLCRSSAMVMLTLSIRIVCRYFGYFNVFLGTNDNYGFSSTVFDLQALADGVLWVYLLLLRLYSPQNTITYSESHITNILLEYPFLQKI